TRTWTRAAASLLPKELNSPRGFLIHRLHDAGALDMLAPVSERKESKPAPKSAAGLRASMRAEFALVIGLGTSSIFYATGNRFVVIFTQTIGLIVVFLL